MLFNENGMEYSAPVEANPINDEFKISVFEGDDYYFSSAIFDGEYIWLRKSNGIVACHDPQTFQLIRTIDNVVGDYGAYLKGKICYYNATQACLVDLNSSAVKHLDVSGRGVTVCQDYFWLNNASDENGSLVRIDLDGNVTKYLIAELVQHLPNAILTDGENLWFLPMTRSGNNAPLIKIELDSMDVTTFVYTGHPYPGYQSGIFDGRNIWMAPYEMDCNYVLKFDTTEGRFTAYPLAEGANGNANIGDYATRTHRFARAAFDGRYMWMSPYYYDRLVRVDTQTGVMRGYEITSDGLNTNSPGCIGLSFDGTYLWLLSHEARKILRIGDDENGKGGINPEPKPGDGCNCFKVELKVTSCGKNTGLLQELNDVIVKYGDKIDCDCDCCCK